MIPDIEEAIEGRAEARGTLFVDDKDLERSELREAVLVLASRSEVRIVVHGADLTAEDLKLFGALSNVKFERGDFATASRRWGQSRSELRIVTDASRLRRRPSDGMEGFLVSDPLDLLGAAAYVQGQKEGFVRSENRLLQVSHVLRSELRRYRLSLVIAVAA